MTAKEQVTALIAQITKATTVEKSAQVLVETLPKRIADAVAAAVANGATAEELQPVSDLGTELANASDALNTAVLANTPAAPETARQQRNKP